MTTKLPFTYGGLRRAIKAARKSGLYVIGIRPDGTLLVSDRPAPEVYVALQPDPGQAEDHSRWLDIKV